MSQTKTNDDSALIHDPINGPREFFRNGLIANKFSIHFIMVSSETLNLCTISFHPQSLKNIPGCFPSEGVCTMVSVSWYAFNITQDFFDPFYPGTRWDATGGGLKTWQLPGVLDDNASAACLQVRNRRRTLHRLVLCCARHRRGGLSHLLLQI